MNTGLVETLRIVRVEDRARSWCLAGGLAAPVLAPTLAVQGLPVTICNRAWDALSVVWVDCRTVVGSVARGWAGVVGPATLAPFFDVYSQQGLHIVPWCSLGWAGPKLDMGTKDLPLCLAPCRRRVCRGWCRRRRHGCHCCGRRVCRSRGCW